MDLQQCYGDFGGSYDEVYSRIRSETVIRYLLQEFCQNNQMESIRTSILRGKNEKAIKSLYRLIGDSVNLGMDSLVNDMWDLINLLDRGVSIDKMNAKLDSTQKTYNKTVNAINFYLAQA